MINQSNVDLKVVEGFGSEWETFDQSSLNHFELLSIFNQYFKIFPWHTIKSDSIGFDLGCGTGRWAKVVAPKVGKLICVDPSKAMHIAKRNLSNLQNCEFLNEGVGDLSIPDGTMDFGYSLGVLHHIPDTFEGIKVCSKKLKKGAPFLIYLYYSFDNKPIWFRFIWQLSNLLRKIISRFPFKLKAFICLIIALTVYFPLARIAFLVEKLGLNVANLPLSAYRNCSLYTMKTDSLDRFGTTLEHRFSRNKIFQMLTDAGFKDIKFSEEVPFWCAVGIKC